MRLAIGIAGIFALFPFRRPNCHSAMSIDALQI